MSSPQACAWLHGIQRFTAVRLATGAFVVISLLMSILMLPGCEDSSKQETASSVASAEPAYTWGVVKGRTITVWGEEMDLSRPFLRKAFDRYEKLTGNTVRVVAFPVNQASDRFAAGFRPGSTEKPDILLSYGGTAIESLDPENNFYTFNDAVWVDDLTDTALNQSIFNGKIIGLPHWEGSISGMLYNKEIFRRFNLRVPRTQKEFLEVCDTLLRNGITPVYVPNTRRMLYQFPLDTMVRDPKVLAALNSEVLTYAQIPEMRQMLEWFRTMAGKGFFGSDMEKNSWDGMEEAMRTGTHAMSFCWDTWLYTNFKGDPAQFGLMPAFMGVPEEGTFEGPNLCLLLANKNSPELDAAKDLITFMADPYNYNVAFAGIYTAPAFKNQAGSLITPQYAEAERLVERLYHDSIAWPRIRGFSQMDAEFIGRLISEPNYSIDDCLKDLDQARINRTSAR